MLTLIPGGIGNAMFDRLWRDFVSIDPTRTFSPTSVHRGSPSPAPSRIADRWPGLNVWRDGERIVAEAEIPGFRMEDVELFATDDTLTLRGRRPSRVPQTTDGSRAIPLRVERSVQSFERSLRLPVPIDPEHVEATLVDGVLRVTMPLAQSARPRRVEIRPAAAPSTRSIVSTTPDESATSVAPRCAGAPA